MATEEVYRVSKQFQVYRRIVLPHNAYTLWLLHELHRVPSFAVWCELEVVR